MKTVRAFVGLGILAALCLAVIGSTDSAIGAETAQHSVMPLEASWPVDKALARRLDYTGYVADRRRTQALPIDAGNGGEIVVSGGGSSVSLRLLTAALGAAESDQRLWRILVSGY